MKGNALNDFMVPGSNMAVAFLLLVLLLKALL